MYLIMNILQGRKRAIDHEVCMVNAEMMLFLKYTLIDVKFAVFHLDPRMLNMKSLGVVRHVEISALYIYIFIPVFGRVDHNESHSLLHNGWEAG